MSASHYLRHHARARSTGVLVEVFDTSHPDNVFDPDGGRWVTFCLTHGSVVNHRTLALARSFAAAPEEWCDECRELA